MSVKCSIFSRYSKKLIKGCFHALGFELQRAQTQGPPLLYDDPLIVVHKINSHETAAIRCEITKCNIFNGFTYGNGGWHPFVEAIRFYSKSDSKNYQGSFLQRYYSIWQPKDALDALIGVPDGPDILRNYPSYVISEPWSNFSCDEVKSRYAQIALLENGAYGMSELTIDADGYGLHGPVSEKKGEIEHKRLISVFNSIRCHGYDRTSGDITVQVLKRDGDFRYRVTHGYHRAAALTCLGFDSLPAVPVALIQPEEVDHWPQVYRGVWTKKQALKYFNHHFDFEPGNWASQHNLILQ